MVARWQWPEAAALAACFLLALLPIVWSEGGLAAMLVYVQLPIYLIHQLEEHRGDRFRTYINAKLGGEILTRPATFAINLFGVWALMSASFLLAYYVEPALGLIAVYLTAVNALAHLAGAAATRAYNPGLATAVILFVPLSIWAIIEVNRTYDVPAGDQILAIAIAIVSHLAIIAYVARRRRNQPTNSGPATGAGAPSAPRPRAAPGLSRDSRHQRG